ncbi:hypothetical protein [Marinibacterium profundimaris]|uniref:Uncharacterized protein n=1 Tax=Marinibacterium profundimaris TaxID=1679460 RepID=A0A225NNF4_9RHOB|nr:hypothetical protein [Marinibacterium profundimaris]OWU75819.1 hypothetical protein ATO3_06430 [Marinibacterium profundimaris]
MCRRIVLGGLLALGVLVALSSAISAALMAPERGAVQREVHALIYGGDLVDLCGEEARHDHRCPLCHGLPDAPEIRLAVRTFLLEPHDAWGQSDDLHRAAQARNICHSTRAPPISV